ncbi:3-hydroxybutyryl dehydratase [Diplogelasinospora grovesii]|uniref:3-hydroxybutyryl dehydratase n=1 Tax=Diplogelasinospora grovesii TaxID=303347 RepID=A0AAN6NFC5_9PEZI|nr:3-hydroxybutyryl dehydratase [Diplogelasinospora grovesii]
MSSGSGRYIGDEWPTLSDGREYDVQQLLALVRDGNSPFKKTVDMNLVIREVEAAVGLHCKLSDQREILVRLGRSDVNMPNYDGFDMDFLLGDIKFETAVYKLLELNSEVPVSRLLYSRLPVIQRTDHRAAAVAVPTDLAGRRLMVFEKVDGRDNVWGCLSPEGKRNLLAQAARIRTSLFNFIVPADFAATWFLPRTFKFMPKELPLPFTTNPTREFWTVVFQSKIEATIGEEGQMIGWESDNNIVGPEASKAKQSLLRFIPHMLPTGADTEWLYRPVLEHGDYGIHNMSIAVGATGEPLITSLYDWETGSIVPGLLADPEMAVPVDLTADENGQPRITRVGSDATTEYCNEYLEYADHYLTSLYKGAPDFKRCIVAGRDARYLWSALKNWRGDEPEDFFGSLGAWADRRMLEIGAGSHG